MFRISDGFFVIFLLNFANAAQKMCSDLKPSPNSEVNLCTDGNNFRSVCTIGCSLGYDKSDGGTRAVCWCADNGCSWQGEMPVCKKSECPYPDQTIGTVRIADDWLNGFAAILEIDSIPEDITSGWALVIVFKKPLGPRASLFSWNMRLTAASFDKKTFTLNNGVHNKDFVSYFTRKKRARMMVIVSDVEGDLPTSGYVGLYKKPVKDASCVRVPAFSDFKLLPSSDELDLVFESDSVENVIKDMMALTPPAPATSAVTKVTTTMKTTTTKQPETTTLAPSTTIKTTKSTTKTTTIPTAKPTTTKSIPPTTTAGLTFITSKPNAATKINGRFCKLQTHADHYNTQRGWVEFGIAYFNANAVINAQEILQDWRMALVFTTPITSIEVWNCRVENNSESGYLWQFEPFSYNTVLHPGMFDVSFIAKQKHITSENPTALVYLCSSLYTSGEEVITKPEKVQEYATYKNPPTEIIPVDEGVEDEDAATSSPEKTTTKAPVKEERCMAKSPSGVVIEKAPQTKPAVKLNKDKTKYNLDKLLHLSILFYEAQRAGYLPPRYKRIPWRGHSALKDGCDIGVDLSRGWYDAGDHIKFNFPMAFSVTTLAWGGILFRDAYRDAGEVNRFLGSIKWPVEYLIACHISKYELVGQVGKTKDDHDYWGRPEEMRMERPVYKITKDKPGSELAAETAAALASASIVLRKSHRKLSFSAIKHAEELYEFADKYRGLYHKAIPQAATFYRSASGYDDELLWGAAWLYKATKKKHYLDKARAVYEKMRAKYFTGPNFSWDHKLIGAQALLANLTGEDIFRSQVVSFLSKAMKTPKTPQGMMFYDIWAPNKYAANAAFIALVASTLEPPLPKRDDYMQFALDQIYLLVGDAGRSYVVGFGENPPEQPHHRSSSCPPYPGHCSFTSAFHSRFDNPYTLYGALVGGPAKTGYYGDVRSNYKQTEVSCDNNAGFQSAVAGLKHFVMQNRTSHPPAPKRKSG